MRAGALVLVLLLVGVAFIAAGVYLAGYTEQRVRVVNASGQWVNATKTVDLGFIGEGDKIKLAFRTWAEDPIHRNILITLVNSETGEIIPERRYGLAGYENIISLYWNASQDGYTTWGEYYPPKPGKYQFILDNKAYVARDPIPIKLVTFEAVIVGPSYAPYLTHGAITIVVGIATIAAALIFRAKYAKRLKEQ
ncbi:MAG: hypothetical protein QW702_09160 [Candidatus Bathyarchaeia archaeon]